MTDDNTEKYRILFKGKIEAGQDLSAVKEHLAQLFKAPPERIERLFTGKAVTLNNNLDYTTAQEYVIELKNAGVPALLNQCWNQLHQRRWRKQKHLVHPR